MRATTVGKSVSAREALSNTAQRKSSRPVAAWHQCLSPAATRDAEGRAGGPGIHDCRFPAELLPFLLRQLAGARDVLQSAAAALDAERRARSDAEARASSAAAELQALRDGPTQSLAAETLLRPQLSPPQRLPAAAAAVLEHERRVQANAEMRAAATAAALHALEENPAEQILQCARVVVQISQPPLLLLTPAAAAAGAPPPNVMAAGAAGGCAPIMIKNETS